MLPPAFNPINLNFPWSLFLIPSNPSHSTSRCSQPLLWFRRNHIIVQWRQIGTKNQGIQPDMNKVWCYHISTNPVKILLKCEDTFCIFTESSNTQHHASFIFITAFFGVPRSEAINANINLYANFKTDL